MRPFALVIVLAFGGACTPSPSSPGDAAGAAGAATAGHGATGGSSASSGATAGSSGTPDASGGTPEPRDAAESGRHDPALEAGAVEAPAEAAPPSSLDLSIWELQLPTGSGTSPTTISPAELVGGFSSAYFYRAPAGGRMLMDPATGVTTSGSQHCRTELREMAPEGEAAAWPATGTNTLTVSGKVVQLGGGASGHVTVGQVFNGMDAIPLCELEYSAKLGGFQVLYEEAKGGGTTTNLQAPAALGAPYTFTLALSNGVLTVSIGGQAVYTKTPSAAAATKTFYFKAGDYDQTAAAGPISPTPYTIVEIDALEVLHR